MLEPLTEPTVPPPAEPVGAQGSAGAPAPASRRRTLAVAVAVTAGVLLGAALWIALTDMRPSYDAFGWLVWGQQVLHWKLNTDGAPSWKPLTFLFTLPYALTGRDSQVYLWMLTATAGALAGSVFAARIAFRLVGPTPARPWAGYLAAGFAGLGVLGLDGYSQLVLIANSDPLVVAICLAAIDSHLCRRPRLAFGLLVLASLGRPEAWPFAGLYALWLGRTVPRMGTRAYAVGGLVLIPLAWFLIPGLTSHSWFSAGDLALNKATVIHGSKFIGVLGRLRSLYEWPMQVAVLLGIVIAGIRRDRLALGLLAAAALWVATEIAFALHGWSAVPRYLIEPAAVLVVVGGAGIGWTLAYRPPFGGLALAWVPTAVAVLVVIALIPAGQSRVRVARVQFHAARHAALEFTRLESVVRRLGGAAAIKSCGQPVTLVGYQSEVGVGDRIERR